MHTYIADEIYISHNYGFDGDIIITKKVGNNSWSSYQTTSKQILEWVRSELPDRDIALESMDNKAQPITLHIPVSLLREFVVDRLVRRRLESWLEEADNATLLRLLPLIVEYDDKAPTLECFIAGMNKLTPTEVKI